MPKILRRTGARAALIVAGLALAAAGASRLPSGDTPRVAAAAVPTATTVASVPWNVRARSLRAPERPIERRTAAVARAPVLAAPQRTPEAARFRDVAHQPARGGRRTSRAAPPVSWQLLLDRSVPTSQLRLAPAPSLRILSDGRFRPRHGWSPSADDPLLLQGTNWLGAPLLVDDGRVVSDADGVRRYALHGLVYATRLVVEADGGPVRVVRRVQAQLADGDGAPTALVADGDGSFTVLHQGVARAWVWSNRRRAALVLLDGDRRVVRLTPGLDIALRVHDQETGPGGERLRLVLHGPGGSTVGPQPVLRGTTYVTVDRPGAWTASLCRSSDLLDTAYAGHLHVADIADVQRYELTVPYELRAWGLGR